MRPLVARKANREEWCNASPLNVEGQKQSQKNKKNNLIIGTPKTYIPNHQSLKAPEGPNISQGLNLKQHYATECEYNLKQTTKVLEPKRGQIFLKSEK